jgi:tRNA threonylcarbamoyladenosine biosynthesis protein TsaE
MIERGSCTADGEAAMVALGETLGRAIAPPMVIYLSGQLGMGKTTLARGILRAFGHQGAVKSPTYTLVEPYEMDDISLYHFDLYRLGDPEELEYMGIRDYFSTDSIALVEWPDRGHGILPPADISIRIEATEKGRILYFEACGEAGVECFRKLPIECFETGEPGVQ